MKKGLVTIIVSFLTCNCAMIRGQQKNDNSPNSKLLDSLKTIQEAWKKDSCGGSRDSICNFFKENSTLINLSEREVYSLLGYPYYSSVSENSKLLVYRVIGAYDPILKTCDPNLIAKTLNVSIDIRSSKVYYFATAEE